MPHDSAKPRGNSAATPGTLIHLGMPKTATTFLQSFLFAKHSQIVYLGKREGVPHYCSPTIEELVQCLRHPSHRLRGKIVDEVKRELASRRIPGKLLVVSDEGFTYSGRSNKRDQALAMRDTFGDCRILLTIREPLSFMETLYFQELRGYHYNPKQFSRLVRRYGRPPQFFDFESWLQGAWSSKHHGAFDHLMVYETAEAYADVFGEQKVIVKVYEEMKGDNSGFIRRLSDDLGIDADESLRHCEHQDSTKNARWLQAHVDRLKLFNRSRLLHWKFRLFKTPRQLKEFLGVVGPHQITDSPVARVEYPPLWRERIRDIGKDQFARLAARWNLPLDRYAYPLADRLTSPAENSSHGDAVPDTDLGLRKSA